MVMVTLRYWAAAREAAGVAEEKVSADTLAGALAAALAARQEAALVAAPAGDGAGRLRRILGRSSFLIDGDPVGRRDPASVTLAEAVVIEVLPPFAGG